MAHTENDLNVVRRLLAAAEADVARQVEIIANIRQYGGRTAVLRSMLADQRARLTKLQAANQRIEASLNRRGHVGSIPTGRPAR